VTVKEVAHEEAAGTAIDGAVMSIGEGNKRPKEVLSKAHAKASWASAAVS
jgi:hypothetical protein